jgi:hypothetical protein
MARNFLTNLTAQVEGLISNNTLVRSDLISKLFDGRREIDTEVGYPADITVEMYKRMYDREGVAKRIVHFWPEESWCLDPLVYETVDVDEETPFEKELKQLLKRKNLFHYMQRVDEMSGIGTFGLLLLGFDDGKPLSEPMEGVEAAFLRHEGGEPFSSAQTRRLLYLRIFAEDHADVNRREGDSTHPRYGKPVDYNLRIVEYGQSGEVILEETHLVHWTRVIHVADNREMSEVHGTPRLKGVWNRLLDHQKVMGGSGEMFWKGAFPGYALETHEGADDVEFDAEGLRDSMQNYFNGLQRYLALTGVTVKSLTPQMGDPTSHRQAIMDDIAFSMGVPKRKLFGSEQAQLASTQDSRTWNGRVMRRNNKHVTHSIVRPTIDRLMMAGVLPPLTVEDDYEVHWPDLNTVTDEEKALVAKTRTEAYATYVSGNVDQVIPPHDYHVVVHGMDPQEAEQLMESAREYMGEVEEGQSILPHIPATWEDEEESEDEEDEEL